MLESGSAAVVTGHHPHWQSIFRRHFAHAYKPLPARPRFEGLVADHEPIARLNFGRIATNGLDPGFLRVILETPGAVTPDCGRRVLAANLARHSLRHLALSPG